MFKEKLTRSPISNFFPDYSGGDSYDAGSAYFQQRFVSLNQSHTKTMCVRDVLSRADLCSYSHVRTRLLRAT